MSEYVTILGILIAVVLAFNAAITFTTDSIDAVKGMNPFSIGFVLILVGMILFDSTFVLFSFLHQIMDTGNRFWGLAKRTILIAVNTTLVGVAICIGVLAYWTDNNLAKRIDSPVPLLLFVVGLLVVLVGCVSFYRDGSTSDK